MDKGHELPPLPDRITTLDGQLVDLRGEIWQLRVAADGGKIVRIKWPKLTTIATRNNHPVLTKRTIQLVYLYLADRLTRRKSSTVLNDFETFVTFSGWLIQNEPGKIPFAWHYFDEGTARAFLSWCETTADKGNRFSRLRVFYEWGVARRYPDFDRAFLQTLKAIRVQGNIKGHHVRFRHPTKGPLSEGEKRLLVNAIQNDCGADKDRALVMLHLELGANPHALVRLTNRDFIQVKTQHGDFYQLDVPRVKKRTAQRETKRRPISRQLGQLLQQLAAGKPEEALLHWLPADWPSSAIRAAMQRFVKDANLVSPRTNKWLDLHPRRFRYTLATHLAAEGASKFHIAEVLDHTDLQNVNVYVETTPAIVDQVAAATDTSMKPVVNRFLGKISNDLEGTGVHHTANGTVIPADTPHIPLPMLNAGGVGVCGRNVRQDGLCRLFPPLSCYLCPSFVAWRQGPHQELLTSLETFIAAYREQADQRILQQLDEIREMMVEVVARCVVDAESAVVGEGSA